jgi:hypothetical protein
MADQQTDGAALRLAFVGQQTFFRACALDERSERVETTYIDYRAGRDPALMRSRLDAFKPDAVVLFRPETVPAGVLADLPAAILGFLTEPVSREHDGAVRHWDLELRRKALLGLDPANVDRLVSFDPLIVPTVEEIMEVWRSLPIPVGDRFYRPVRRLRPEDGPPKMLFVGRSTVHRERYLLEVKHRFDCLHAAFGIQDDELEGLLERHHITFNIHNEPYPSFENRVFIHLAAGHLVITEPLSPPHGLEPGVDLIVIDSPEELLAAATEAHDDFDRFHAMRESGRQKAEAVRASRVWPQLVSDMLADLAERGTHRSAGPERAPVPA